MGTTYVVVNSDKQQYFDPMGFGESTKAGGLLMGFAGNALGRLILGDVNRDLFLESWSGDRLYIVSDSEEPSQIPRSSHETERSKWDYEIVTEDYNNITLNLLALLLRDEGHAAELLRRADTSNSIFIRIVRITEALHAPWVEFALVNHFGDRWRERYSRCLMEWPEPTFPTPMTDQNRKNRQP